jgi:GTPase SAR1 family protein
MNLDYNRAEQNLRSLIARFPESALKNEAETRFHFIDEFLIRCLGWEKSEIHVENYEAGEYTDYEIGSPRSLILEAKREGVSFDIPVRPKKQLSQSIRSIIALSATAKSAIEQVQTYCATRGVRYAAISNGPQLIAFVAVRLDGQSPFDGTALVIDGFEQLKEEFAKVFQYLSPLGIAANKLSIFLDASKVTGIPDKLSSRLANYPAFRYQTTSANHLRMVAELLLEDVIRTPELETRFYRECYCESGALAQDALVSKNLLKTRYAALFNPAEEAPLLSPATKKGVSLSSEIMAEGLSRRPIILIGDVGVGKTSFIKNLILVQASEEFKQAISIYLDLGVNSFLDTDLESFVTREIQTQLRERHNIDVTSNDFIMSLYREEINRFDKGIYGFLKADNPGLYQSKLLEMLEQKINSFEQHLRNAFIKISKDTRKQIIIIIDNVDQRELEIQQKAFIISQSIAQHWHAVVFLAVRPNTFHQSKRIGSLSAYPNKVFYIMPPRPELVLERRLIFALNMAEGKLPVEALSSVTLNLTNLALFIKALLNSLRKNPQIPEFLSNITGGNVRSMIDFITKFIGSPNVDSDKIIDVMAKKKLYIIPLHEFAKNALLGDYSHFDPRSSIAMNIFDVRFPDRREHFLCAILLGYLNYDASHRNGEGFVTTEAIEKELQLHGFSTDQTDSALRRLTNKKLIETTQRVTFEETSGADLQGDMPDAFRVTTVGAYHVSRWCGTFAYLDAMVLDTPIFDSTYRDTCSNNIDSFEIRERYKRTVKFKEYLDVTWTSLGIAVPYFAWTSATDEGRNTFHSVQSFIGSMR